MPLRPEAPAGAPIWVDLMTSDMARSHSFYFDLFGWHLDDVRPEFGGYCNFMLREQLIAGCMHKQPGVEFPDSWSVYFRSDDAAETARRAEAAGGQVIVPPHPVAELGTMMVFADPAGAVIGGWQPGTHRGFGYLGEPGAPTWFEAASFDFDATVSFVSTVFGLDVDLAGSPDVRYAHLLSEGQPVAGVLDANGVLPDGGPSYWGVYFEVADVEASAREVERLGGEIVAPPHEMPFGRPAVCRDVTGAAFTLLQR